VRHARRAVLRSECGSLLRGFLWRKVLNSAIRGEVPGVGLPAAGFASAKHTRRLVLLGMLDVAPWLQDLHEFPLGGKAVTVDKTYLNDRLVPFTLLVAGLTLVCFVCLSIRLCLGIWSPKRWLCWGLFCCCSKRSCGKSCCCCGVDPPKERVMLLRQMQLYE